MSTMFLKAPDVPAGADTHPMRKARTRTRQVTGRVVHALLFEPLLRARHWTANSVTFHRVTKLGFLHGAQSRTLRAATQHPGKGVGSSRTRLKVVCGGAVERRPWSGSSLGTYRSRCPRSEGSQFCMEIHRVAVARLKWSDIERCV